MKYDVRGLKGRKPRGTVKVFDANGNEILYPVYCDTDTGEVERFVHPGKDRTVTEYHDAPLILRKQR